MVHPYLNRRQGREKPDCLHPSLEPVLRRTLGVPLFQEQLLKMAMIAAGFTGGQAEELRRAMGFKRSEKRMADIEVTLRAGMDRNRITGKAQDAIVHSITAFALYGFPESHAASFALLAYASAYLKCRYLAAFTCAMLNNQPMGFYSPAILIKDAQRHGLRVLPVDVHESDWLCTVAFTRAPGQASPLRLGLRYAKGLREESARAILRARPFTSIDDLALRVPDLRKDEINRLAEIGALNSICALNSVAALNSLVALDSNAALDSSGARNPNHKIHRRDALWQAQRSIRPVGPLLESLEEKDGASPLTRMNTEERLWADYRGTGLTVGKHPMAYRRAEMDALGVIRAADLARVKDGRIVRIAGSVIVRQRPGTAKGFVFLSMEDETGIMNAIVNPGTFDRFKFAVLGEPFLIIDGILQNLDGVISVKAGRVAALRAGAASPPHNFH